ncbi:GDP-mannose-dependent alpha-(1-6)-phosphatidylinositol dimannoside mannosyltransferase [Posidoniimonas corsicana]|uniref:GDP-mannose-dependent alpha-(1-6)-phosphatidylinositol dimannoside mannosyltransferase n=1 Tax=Posidoniimonas corsicana TaxID=1938618 RepID=A0A5C5VG01_9BACT|nr:glycosyltransferase [Posidoniimonas corsicana]TWT37496.1 GDP-mannose-dependent alpha-(1-6)-phosphatidylinositol dimannoside mannosyltransferase [Posidoniimonas corsicana]
MRFCDVTLSYTETSGGIRTYIDAKRDYLLEHTNHHHVLIVPGHHDEVEEHDRCTIHRIASPTLPGCEPYRFFWRPDKIRQALDQSAPDVVELGSFYVAPWPVFGYRKDRQAAGHPTVVGGYFHTDIAEAYVGQPMRHAFGEWNDAIEWLGDRLAELTEKGAEKYVGSVFDHCDLRMASSPKQAARLVDHNVPEVHVVPLGVDLQRFTPDRRSQEVHRAMGVPDNDLALIYAGRLDVEKHVELLVDAVELLPDDMRPHLILVGEGPLRGKLEKRAKENGRTLVLPYEDDPDRFANLLASADLYVTAGPTETFGLSVLEAQASGLPVVGVEAGALVERVPSELGALGPVDDARAFADNIQQVAPNRQELGRNARRHVEQHFGWDSTFRKLLGLYDDALASHGLPAAKRAATGAVAHP